MKVLAILVLIFGLILSPCCAAEKKVGNQDEQKRIERVEKGIKALLEKEKCTLDAFVILTVRGVEPKIRIVPLEPEKKAEKTEKK